MGIFERIASNANNKLNSESAALARKKLIRKGSKGAGISFFCAVIFIVAGILMLVYKVSTVAGVLCLVAAGLSFLLSLIFLIVFFAGIAMAAGGAGAEILDTTSVCPYCKTVLSAKEKQCPSCGKLKSAE